MNAKRGDRVAPPPGPDEYDLRFASAEAAKGWTELCAKMPGPAKAAFHAIQCGPCPVPRTDRHHQLTGQLSSGVYDGRAMGQWQYEVSGGARIWYLADREKRIAWLTYAGVGHPKASEKKR